MSIDWGIVTMLAIAGPLCIWGFWLASKDDAVRKPPTARGEER